VPRPADGADANPTHGVPEPAQPAPTARGRLTEAERLWVYGRLAALRMSQRDLATAMGVSQPTVTKWLARERGMGGPQRTTLLRVLKAATEPLGPAPPEAVTATHWNVEAAPPHLLPVYAGNARGNPLDPARRAVPEGLGCPPPGLAALIGSRGFAVRMRGVSLMARPRRPVEVGDWCWVAPDATDLVRPGALVAAEVRDPERPNDAGVVVRELGPGGASLVGYTPEGHPKPIACAGFAVLGPVVRLERSLSPD
jgi:transcriptional regulator with XRE-family HTH domain